MSGSDVVFDMIDSDNRHVVHVTVSEGAIEDWGSRRGSGGSTSEIFGQALFDILEAVDEIYRKHREKPTSILATSRDLNG